MGKPLTRTREIFLPANSAFTDGTPAAEVGGAAYGVIILVDGATKTIYWTLKVPPDFLSLVSVKLIWISVAAAGDINLGWWAFYGAEGENRIAGSDPLAYAVDATNGANIINATNRPLTLPALKRGDYVGIQTSRGAALAADTLNADVQVFGLLFTYIGERDGKIYGGT